MIGKSTNEIESSVSTMMIQFLEIYLGEKPAQVSTKVMGNNIIVRIKGILQPAERHMMRNKEGENLIKELKNKLIEMEEPLLEETIAKLIGAEVVDIYSTFDAETGERIEIFTLTEDLEKLREA
ncbi:MAG: DUF2294 domain-containing protein [bacterium]